MEIYWYYFNIKLNFYNMWGPNMKNIKIVVVIHKQLTAREILNEDSWRSSYNYFNEGKRNNGIYFYTYNKSTIPYYIGICASKSYNILGRVWTELNDYRNGRYYLPTEPDRLSTLECFKNGISPETFFIPGSFSKDDKSYQDALNTMLDNTRVIFSYLEMNPQADYSKIKHIIYNIEALFQKNIVDAMDLHPKWIDGEGNGFALEPLFNYTVDFAYEKPELKAILNTELLLGRKRLHQS